MGDTTASVHSVTLATCHEQCKHGRSKQLLPGVQLIQCCMCAIWFHNDCVGMMEGDALPGVWPCPTCRKIPSQVKSLQDDVQKLLRDNKELKLALLTIQGLLQTRTDKTKNAYDDYDDDPNKPTGSLVLGDSIIRNIRSLKEDLKISRIHGSKFCDLRKPLISILCKYENIFILCGTGDIPSRHTADQIVKDCKQMLQLAKEKAKHVHLSSILPRSDAKADPKRNDAINKLLIAETESLGVNFINNDKNFLRQDGSIDEQLLSSDGLHLSASGVEKLLQNLGLQNKAVPDSRAERKNAKEPPSDSKQIPTEIKQGDITYAKARSEGAEQKSQHPPQIHKSVNFAPPDNNVPNTGKGPMVDTRQNLQQNKAPSARAGPAIQQSTIPPQQNQPVNCAPSNNNVPRAVNSPEFDKRYLRHGIAPNASAGPAMQQSTSPPQRNQPMNCAPSNNNVPRAVNGPEFDKQYLQHGIASNSSPGPAMQQSTSPPQRNQPMNCALSNNNVPNIVNGNLRIEPKDPAYTSGRSQPLQRQWTDQRAPNTIKVPVHQNVNGKQNYFQHGSSMYPMAGPAITKHQFSYPPPPIIHAPKRGWPPGQYPHDTLKVPVSGQVNSLQRNPVMNSRKEHAIAEQQPQEFSRMNGAPPKHYVQNRVKFTTNGANVQHNSVTKSTGHIQPSPKLVNKSQNQNGKQANHTEHYAVNGNASDETTDLKQSTLTDSKRELNVPSERSQINGQLLKHNVQEVLPDGIKASQSIDVTGTHSANVQILISGPNTSLSNLYLTPITIWGKTFKSVEHAYNYNKAIEMGQHKTAEAIQNARSGRHAKNLAKSIQMDEHWFDTKTGVMFQLLQAKANQCEAFKEDLLSSQGKSLVEDSPHEFWGRGESGQGLNMLGCLMMTLRDDLSKMHALSPDQHLTVPNCPKSGINLEKLHKMVNNNNNSGDIIAK